MEYFDVVNEDDEVIGRASREECHKDPKLIHRAANVYVFSSPALECILRVKRAESVDTERGKWTILIGEHNKQGEDYEAAARRGLIEEIGLKGISLQKAGGKLIQRPKYETEINQNFIGIYEGDLESLKLNRSEVEKVDFMPVSELLNDVKNNRDSYVSYIESALKVILPHIRK